jgi:cell division septation protein DedD
MTDYNVKFTDTNKTPLVVAQDTEDASGTDLVMFGRSFLEYGEQLNENLVKLLENFACPEQHASFGVQPDTSATHNEALSEPVDGQLWFNTTAKALYQYTGDAILGKEWRRLSSGSDYAANWGQIADGEALPRPVSSSGYMFQYNECVWLVSAAGHTGRFDYMTCTTDINAVVNAKYRLLGNGSMTSGVANYLIVGIKGNTNAGATSYTNIGLPGITPTPTSSPGASVTPSPVVPTPTPSVSTSQSAVPQPSVSASAAAPTPTPSATRAPSPTPSSIPSLVVQITDVERGGNYVDSLSLCDISDYSTTRDYGTIGCDASNFGMCGVGECSPSPGSYAGGESAPGAVMGVTVTGGVAPYTVRFKNFTATSGAAAFAASGDCLFIGGSSGFNAPNTGIVYSVVIGASGGSVNGLSEPAHSLTP